MKKLFLIMAAVAVSAMSMSCDAKSGEKYKEIALDSPEGTEIMLSEVIKDNKYTLLDFWASWCPPCMREVPYLQSAYANFKDKGFEIYAVSYDDNTAAWQKAVEANQMGWLHVSSLQGWDCPTQPLYGVQSIPRNFLIDRKGNIVAKNLRGSELERQLRELLK